MANAIEAIAIYESINQAKQRKNKVAGNDSKKRKWEGAIFTTLVSLQKNVAIAKRDCRIPVPRAKQRSVVSGKKAEVICYGCGGLGHYKSNCLIVTPPSWVAAE
ncbi:putative reverse transcriptase domain-containing protein [Tanacetum coccineum]